MLLAGGIGAVLIGCALVGYAFMWITLREQLPFDRVPVGALRLHSVPLCAGAILLLFGLAALFVVKWYAGLAGLAGALVAINVLHDVWLVLFGRMRVYVKLLDFGENSGERVPARWLAVWLGLMRWLLTFGHFAVECPNCGTRLTMPRRNLGLRGVCPECHQTFEAGTEDAPIDEEPDDDLTG